MTSTVEHQKQPTTLHLGTPTVIDVPEGPALRINAREETWLLPVNKTMGTRLAALITLRVRRLPREQNE